jgi:hypothetical protein
MNDAPEVEELRPATDAYEEVLNRPETYKAIAVELWANGSTVIGWTDEQGSHHDVLFTLHPRQWGHLQRGLRGWSDLFVSLMGSGAHGFDVNRGSHPLDPGYVAEKLRPYDSQRSLSSTDKALTDLINGVLNALVVTLNG